LKTIAACVQDILAAKPFLEEALSRDIINFSALAKDLNPLISERLRRPVKDGAITMALRRYKPPITKKNAQQLRDIFKQLGDITLRSNLTDITFQNSKTLTLNHSKLLAEINADRQVFYAFTRGVFESNIIISSSKLEQLQHVFKNEIQIGIQDHLSAISINLPQGNSKVVGLYYQIFKRLAWENVTLYEVVSTTNEFTILVEDPLVDKAFSVIKGLKS
jgi:aspartokinase|tara:strand:+ start:577 stop:1233 length:657 start_codon:yes stop_codon:yes gene_type:complete